MEYLAFPWEQIGMLLRKLSLYGGARNVIAWIIYLIIGGSPLVLWGWLVWKKRSSKVEVLLVLLSVVMFAGMWFLINPSYMEQVFFPAGLGEMGKYVFALTIDSILMTWLLLRFLKGYEKKENKDLLRYLEYLLSIYLVLVIAAIIFSGSDELMTAWKALGEGNSASESEWMWQLSGNMQGRSLSFSYLVLFFQMICKYLPEILEVVLWGVVIGFLRSCENGGFNACGLQYVQRLKKLSAYFLGVILCTNMGMNFMQLILAPYIYSSHYVLTLPLRQIIVVLGILMLSRFYLDSKKLKEDNELFI